MQLVQKIEACKMAYPHWPNTDPDLLIGTQAHLDIIKTIEEIIKTILFHKLEKFENDILDLFSTQQNQEIDSLLKNS